MRSYPAELSARVREAWPADARPLPSRLEALLDVAYHASFLREEERPVTCRIIVVPPASMSKDGGPPAALLPLSFASPRAFDEHELRRLSPAASTSRALIGADDSNDTLTIWGIVQSGPRWLQASAGGRAKEPPMPRCLVVRVVRPGHLVVSCGSELVAELRGGKLSDFNLDVFHTEWLREAFQDARAASVADHLASAKTPLDERVAADVTRHIGQQMIKRVVTTMRSAHHGGTLVVGPPTCMSETILRPKYDFHDEEPRRRFRTIVLSILEWISERARADGREASLDLYRHAADPVLGDLDEGLFELSNLIAALASVDGAVVLTKRFEILGFGAEIAGSLPAVSEVRRAIDLEASTFVAEVVDAVGTRHRSAYRLCAAVPDAVAIVVSQDGSVRFVNRHRGVVTYWDHGPGD